jgi:hypothetical protein
LKIVTEPYDIQGSLGRIGYLFNLHKTDNRDMVLYYVMNVQNTDWHSIIKILQYIYIALDYNNDQLLNILNKILI